MNPAVPLFLTHRVSDHSQLSEWETVTERRRIRLPRSRRPADRSRARSSATDGADGGVPTGGAPTVAERPAPVAAPTVAPAVAPASDDRSRSRAVWAVVITGLALFMASLDNLVVSTALPSITEAPFDASASRWAPPTRTGARPASWVITTCPSCPTSSSA